MIAHTLATTWQRSVNRFWPPVDRVNPLFGAFHLL